MENKVFNHAHLRVVAALAGLAAVVALAMLATTVLPASASTGGIGLGDSGLIDESGNAKAGNGKCKPSAKLGKRTLTVGSCGGDVRALHWFLKARKYNIGTGQKFDSSTAYSVADFQRSANLTSDGVVTKKTVKAVKKKMKSSQASYYGTGYWLGRTTYCGKKLKKKTIGVAVPAEKIKKFPCGTKVLLHRKGKWVRAKVIDTGGFGHIKNRKWDLTARTAKRLNKNFKRDGVFKVDAVAIKKK